MINYKDSSEPLLLITSNLIIKDVNDAFSNSEAIGKHLFDVFSKDKNAIEEELVRSNNELEQFAYIASHDLQEPLRMVSSYCKLLERRYKDKLDKDGIDFINFAVDGARRMQLLINDLLQYSRVSSKNKELTLIDMNQCFQLAISNLLELIKETDATIVCEDLPKVLGNQMHLVQVFQNLITNSIKYRKDINPEIVISYERINGFYQFCVKDNGMGIDPIHKNRLFVIFQRLHNDNVKYPGTGIGLAICRKIIERHGGKIWFDSELEIGSKFYFTIKEADEC